MQQTRRTRARARILRAAGCQAHRHLRRMRRWSAGTRRQGRAKHARRGARRVQRQSGQQVHTESMSQSDLPPESKSLSDLPPHILAAIDQGLREGETQIDALLILLREFTATAGEDQGFANLINYAGRHYDRRSLAVMTALAVRRLLRQDPQATAPAPGVQDPGRPGGGRDDGPGQDSRSA